MDAIKFLKERRRLLNSLGRTGEKCYGVSCGECPFDKRNNGTNSYCGDFESDYPERTVEIVEKWSKKNPQKTILQDYVEKHPNAPLRESGLPKYVCPNLLGYIGMEQGTCPDCLGCWNRPLEG